MKNKNHYSLVALMLIVSLSGCAQMMSWKTSPKEIEVTTKKSQTKKEQPKEVSPEVARFEEKRNEAMYAAAINRARSNDLNGYGKILDELLARKPNHIDAQLRKAELLLWRSQPENAILLVTNVIKNQPKNAEALHILALVYEAQERTEESISTVQQAIAVSSSEMREFYQMELQRIEDMLVTANQETATGSSFSIQ